MDQMISTVGLEFLNEIVCLHTGAKNKIVFKAVFCYKKFVLHLMTFRADVSGIYYDLQITQRLTSILHADGGHPNISTNQ